MGRNKWWMGLDSNQRTLARTELQSVAINHSATHPRVKTFFGTMHKKRFCALLSSVR